MQLFNNIEISKKKKAGRTRKGKVVGKVKQKSSRL